MMIRKYRLEQNMSQDTLCKGICAVSYLSKIEKGAVLCSDDILSSLFNVLGVSIPNHSVALEAYDEMINNYFHHYFFSNSAEAELIMQELRSMSHVLHHSSLVIDISIAEAYDEYTQNNDKVALKSMCQDLLRYEEYMSDHQSYLLYLLLGMIDTFITHQYSEGLANYNIALHRKRDGIVLACLASSHYLLGDYLESITLGDEAYKLLMEEGNVHWAIGLCFTIAAAYANYRNLNKMLQYYNRILALNNLTKDLSQRAQVYYNIGATYLVNRDYSQALHNLEQAFELSKQENLSSDAYLLLLQKLFLTLMAIGERKKAKEYLFLASDFYRTIPQNDISESLKASLDWMEIMYNKENYLHDENYLHAIKIIFEVSLKDSHHGFHLFYGHYLIEAYKAQRKYKEALKITEALYAKNYIS